MGKTTLIKIFAGLLKPDDETTVLPKLKVSYKPQFITPKFEGTVQDLLNEKLNADWLEPRFKDYVFDRLKIEPLLDCMVKILSGGEI